MHALGQGPSYCSRGQTQLGSLFKLVGGLPLEFLIQQPVWGQQVHV